MIELAALAELAGIQRCYADVWGKEHAVPDATLSALLEGLGFPVSSEVERTAAHAQLAERYKKPLPPVKALLADKPISLLVRGAVSWELTSEDGSLRQGEARRERIELPALAMGYYELTVHLPNDMLRSRLIVSPAECWQPPEFSHGRRVWGIAAQLYGLRCEHNIGMGDFGDLTLLVKAAAQQGADVIGLNPLHAMFPANPAEFSPYAPSNRLFLNTLYIDVQAIENFTLCRHAQQLWQEPGFQSELAQARAQPLVDYPAVAALKDRLLRLLFADFRQNGNRHAYDTFCQEQGEALTRQALFDALSAHFAAHWQAWPEAYHSPDSAELQAFAQAHADAIDYYRWLQFLADAQLAKAQAGALQAGMLIGLYRDLAVGAQSGGAEIWLDAARFIRGASVGAPPDEYNPKGQSWGLPAFNPLLLLERGLAPFSELLRANMRHARALRIDHAFGLSRLFLVPHGKDAHDGAYLTYPFEEMLAVLRLESHRNQCVVIGEDLGTFPPGYKEKAAEAGVFSYKLLYFERDEHGFTPPARYPVQALATLTTHDLPTLAGWLEGADQQERRELDLYPSQELEEKDRAQRRRDTEQLRQALAREDFSTIDNASVQRYLARSPAAIVMLQLEDLLGVTQQVNLPGTTTQRPNWQHNLPETLERITAANGPLAALSPVLNAERKQPLLRPPRATYRLQFHKGFTFDDAARIVPYLAALGISHVYASPYLQARPGSTHGYDITDHNRLNPELGDEQAYARFTQALAEHGLSQILDFVPNHMGVGADNAWWMNVLKWGKDSAYARYFDIDWEPRYGQAEHKLLLPVLGSHYGDALAAGELTLAFDPPENAFYIAYFDNRFPICPRDYASIESPERINADKEALHGLLERQHYRLAFWRVASSDINYRRFFDINELAGMRPEDPLVFDAMHRLVLSLIAQGSIQGLRIDHVDGLADPRGYCRRLKEKAGAGLYLTVEKILASHESLREDWQIEGTSGYEALNQIGGLFVASENEPAMDAAYRRFTQSGERFSDMVFHAKTAILESALASELLSLSLSLKRVAADRYSRDYTLDMLRAALKEVIGWFPVYRTYVTAARITPEDMRFIDWAIGKAKKQSQLPDLSVFDFIGGLLRLQDDPPGEAALTFIRKFQQLSGPVMAKGLEDTSFYRFNRLLSLNEVGGDPQRFGLSAQAFHHANAQRAAHFPHSMLATATHDTKRGEDARCRISALSHMPAQWEEWITSWATLNRSHHSEVEGRDAPSRNEEYALYQALLGSWPLELMRKPLDAALLADYVKRLTEYLTKSLREAKENSSWTHPDEAYEKAVHNFLANILDASRPNKFLEHFIPAARTIAESGLYYSLSQLALKLTIPGMPDIYQGSEYWDLSLVDPDNRRAVDYASRAQTLADEASLPELLKRWESGVVKQQLLRRLLAHRKEDPDLYAYGSYEKLSLAGARAEACVAFARRYERRQLIAVIPIRHDGAAWADTTLELPAGHYRSLLTGSSLDLTSSAPLGGLLADFPLAVLIPL